MSENVFFRLTEIEEKHRSKEEQINYLSEQIEEVGKEFVTDEKKSVRKAVRLGSMLLALKTLLNNRQKKSWEKYLDSEQTCVAKRTAQRCMELAKAIGHILEKNVKLSWLGQTRLCKLANLSKKNGADVVTFLKGNKIDLDFDSKNSAELKEFQEQVDKLVYPTKKAVKKDKKQNKEKSVEESLAEIRDAAKHCRAKLKSSKSMEVILGGIGSEALQDTIKKLKNLIKQLQKAEKKISAKDAERKAA